jgi:hypothetical protein
VERLFGKEHIRIAWADGQLSFSPRQIWVNSSDAAKASRVLQQHRDLSVYLLRPDGQRLGRDAEGPWTQEVVNMTNERALLEIQIDTPRGMALHNSRVQEYIATKERPFVRDVQWRRRMCMGMDGELHDAYEFRVNVAESADAPHPWTCIAWSIPP